MDLAEQPSDIPGTDGTESVDPGADLPTIVVVAFDRPHALARLLQSLERIRTPADRDVHLVISIDDSVSGTMEVARRYAWPFGPKLVIGRDTRLGLRDHVLACGDLTAEYGTIMMLEDDLYASPNAYQFATAAAGFYRRDKNIAGISLYAYRLDEFSRLAFNPLDDGFDTFFMQVPSSWGQLWTPGQWSQFRTWRRTSPSSLPNRLPQKAARWSPEKSWKRLFLEYLIDTDRYFVFPRRSLTTNCGDPGTHFGRAMIDLATPIQVGQRNWRFALRTETGVRYDAWFEPHPETIATMWPQYGGIDVTIDFLGTKPHHQIDTELLLSSRPCPDPIETFPFILQPPALNLALPDGGRFFSLGQKDGFRALPAAKQRRMIEVLNGQIGRRLAGGILFDRAIRRLRRNRSDPRLGDAGS